MKLIDLQELTPDPENPNQGTPEGKILLEHSIRKLKCGRSIVVDRNNCIIAGNKTYHAAIANGVEQGIVVETSGDTLVAVVRTDLDLEQETGRTMAIADNKTAEIGLSWSHEKISAIAESGRDLSGLFSDTELDEIVSEPDWEADKGIRDSLFGGDGRSKKDQTATDSTTATDTAISIGDISFRISRDEYLEWKNDLFSKGQVSQQQVQKTLMERLGLCHSS